METVKVIELTDEEIWLRAYCAAMINHDALPSQWNSDADKCLSDFKERFKGEENGK